jgi:hypothetical protein
MGRRVGAASLSAINPMVRPPHDVASKDGNVTEMFVEAIAVPACVRPAVEPELPEPAPEPAMADPAPVAPSAEPSPDGEPARPTWHERMTRAISARFRRAPREDEAVGVADDAKERLERFHSRRSNSGSSF